MSRTAKKSDTELEVSSEPFEIDCKRLFLPVLIKTKCPQCGEPAQADMHDTDYLSYPRLNHFSTVFCCCANNHDFVIKVRLTFNLEVME